jgi:hypothetical protein
MNVNNYPVIVYNTPTSPGPLLFNVQWGGGNTGAVLIMVGDAAPLPFPAPPPLGTSCWIQANDPNSGFQKNSGDNFTITDPCGIILYTYSNDGFDRQT